MWALLEMALRNIQGTRTPLPGINVNVLSNTIVNLYTHQMAMHERILSILQSGNVQQRVSMADAILACIPNVGGVSGLVQSLFGVGKDWSSSIAEPVVDHLFAPGMLFSRMKHAKIYLR